MRCMRWISALAVFILVFPLHGFDIAPATLGTNAGIVGNGSSMYWRPIQFHSGSDGALKVRVPTAAEFAADGMHVIDNTTQFTIAFHLKNLFTGKAVFVLGPPGHDWSDEARRTVQVCMVTYAYPLASLLFSGSDCYGYLGSACKFDNFGQRVRPSLSLNDDFTVRNGAHVSLVQDGSTTHFYVNGKYILASDVVDSRQPFLCLGGEIRFEDVGGFIRDFRIYPRALTESEIAAVAESCDGSPSYVDDPSFGYKDGVKESDTCMNFYTQLKNGLLTDCPADAESRCLVSCTGKPLCSPPKNVQNVSLGLLGPQTLCINTDTTNIAALVDRCKSLPPFNDSWAAGNWPSVGADRRLGHIPNVVCPGATAEVDRARDIRVTHSSECDFKGAALSAVVNSDAYSMWWWSKRDDQPGIFSFYHSIGITGNTKLSAVYGYEFQDETAWLLKQHVDGKQAHMDLRMQHVEPAYIVDEISNKGRGRWVFKAFVFDGMNSTYFVDGSHDTVTFKPTMNGLDALWVGHPSGAKAPTNFSALKFTATALTVQQMQQIYHHESELYLQCPPGQFHDISKKGKCSKCAVNTFTAMEGMSECRNCAPGYEAAAVESQSCSPCHPGQFSIGGSSCQLCELGTANSLANQSSCSVCPPGRFAGESGALACKHCPAGSFSSGIKEQRCRICKQGSYTAEPGSTECSLCGIGMYQSIASMTSCFNCSRGSFVTEKGNTVCRKCPRGSHQPREGRDSCMPCEKNRYQASDGRVDCNHCPTGRTTLAQGMTDITDCVCLKGYFAEGGTCKSCWLLQSSEEGATSGDDCQFEPGFYIILSIILLILIMVPLVCVIYFLFRKTLLNMKEEQARQQILQGIQHSAELRFSMAVMNVNNFKSLGRLASYEDARDRHLLIHLDTLDKINDFKQDNTIIFCSHQWLGWTEPDPEQVHYNAIVHAIDAVMSNFEWIGGEQVVHMWVDYHSVPQLNRHLQRLAIDTLPFYASLSTVFIIVSPRTTHYDTQAPCNFETYQKRMWCRAELFSFYLQRGLDGLYKMEEIDNGVRMTSVEESEIDDTIFVFEGMCTCCAINHRGMDTCDKDVLRNVFLALYAGVLWSGRSSTRISHVKKTEEIMARIHRQKDRVFPPRIGGNFHVKQRRGFRSTALRAIHDRQMRVKSCNSRNSQTEHDSIERSSSTEPDVKYATRELFGDLISKLEHLIACRDDDIVEILSQRPSGSTKEFMCLTAKRFDLAVGYDGDFSSVDESSLIDL